MSFAQKFQRFVMEGFVVENFGLIYPELIFRMWGCQRFVPHWLVTCKLACKRTNKVTCKVPCKVTCKLILRGKALHQSTLQIHRDQGFFATNKGFKEPPYKLCPSFAAFFGPWSYVGSCHVGNFCSFRMQHATEPNCYEVTSYLRLASDDTTEV